MPVLKAHRRVVIGRNISLTAGVIYALSRAVLYGTLNPEKATFAQSIVSADGRLSGMWATVWALAAALCVADMINKHTRYGLSFVVGLSAAWGSLYLVIWGWNGFRDTDLLTTAIGWLTPAALVFGFLLKVTALQDLLRGRGHEEPRGD